MYELLFSKTQESRGWKYQEIKINVGGTFMDVIKEVTINEAVIHVLDTNSDEPVLNEYKLELNEELYKFILKHIEKIFKDDELKYAHFGDVRNIVKEISQEYLNGESDFLDISKELARQLFILMKSNINILSCDLMIVSFSTEYGPMLGILKLDYVKSFTHKVDFIHNKIGINITQIAAGLPSTSSKIQKCAFIKPFKEGQEYDLFVMDKKSNKDHEQYGSSYFLQNYLGCTVTENDRDQTKAFMNKSEWWIRSNLSGDADRAEAVRTKIKDKLKDEDKIEIKEFAKELFKESDTTKNDFIEFISSQGIEETVNVDKQFIDKKLKRIRLKIDKEIDLYIDAEAYKDINKFEIVRNGDGSINMIIKHVINYIEK